MVSKSLSKKANTTVSPVFTPLERLMNEVSEYLNPPPPSERGLQLRGLNSSSVSVKQTSVRKSSLNTYIKTQDTKAGSIQVWIRNHIAVYRRARTLRNGQ